jgi:MbtH protein
MSTGSDARIYNVAVNYEGQYSLWLAARELPAGWTAAGTTGSREECLALIRRNWTDMRPKSLRQRMQGRV